MATIYTINDDVAALKTALGDAVTAGYFASVADHETDNTVDGVICKDSDSNAVLSLYKISAGGSRTRWELQFTLGSGTTLTDQIGASHGTQDYSAQITKMYVCSGGIYLAFKSTGNGTGKYGGVIISKTNRSKTGVVFAAVPSAASVSATYKGNCRCLATDDEAGSAANYFTFGGQSLRNQTQLNNVSTAANADAISYFEKVKYIPICQYNYADNQTTPPVNFTHSGKRYLWVGSFAILDEEATT